MNIIGNKEGLIKMAKSCGITDTYQHDIILDESRKTIINKARGIGVTTAFAFRALIRTLSGITLSYGGESVVVSRGEEQAEHVIDYVGQFWQMLRPYATGLFLVKDDSGHKKWSNNASILSLPNKAQAVRTFHGDVYLDEFAHFFGRTDKDMVSAITGNISLGGSLYIASTPFGERGEFWRIFEKDKKYKKYKLPYTVCRRKSYQEAVNDEKEHLDPLTFAQEYKCEFMSSEEKPLPYQLIIRQVDNGLRINQYMKTNNAIFGGIDFAKEVDETAIVKLEKSENDVKIIRWVESIYNMPYEDQYDYIERLQNSWNTLLWFYDATVAEKIKEDLNKRLGSKGYPFTFNSQSKINLVFLIKQALIDRKLILPNYEKLIHQLSSLEKRITAFGNVQYGHPEGEMDDLVWALALALRACEEVPSARDFKYKIIEKKPRELAKRNIKWSEAWK